MLDLKLWREWRAWVPAECPGCERRVPGQGLCMRCAASLRSDRTLPRCLRCAHPLVAGYCPDCSRQIPAFDRVVAAFDYQGLGALLIRDYKIRCRLALAGLLADHLTQAVRQAVQDASERPHWVVPVPARQAALRQRGFSPPAELARLLACRLGLPYRLDLVHRVHEGTRQTLLGREARLQAQLGVYACRPSVWKDRKRSQPLAAPNSLAGMRIAVVDDVLTTGATLHAVATALKAAGASRVEGWVLARALQ